MKDKLWPGLVIMALLLVLQIILQRKEKPAVKWLGGGLIVVSAAVWAYLTMGNPPFRPATWFVTWMEPLVPTP